jgi:ABC-2 type transport system ATP-binding protein
VLVTTHELAEAERMADRLLILAAGRIVREGTVADLMAATPSEGMRFGAPPGLDTDSLAAALGDGALVAETAPGRYQLDGVSGPAATATLATWLAERNATLRDLTSGRTLEDVYFDAVGAPALEPPAEPAPSRRRGR